jgi:hypothetical protein
VSLEIAKGTQDEDLTSFPENYDLSELWYSYEEKKKAEGAAAVAAAAAAAGTPIEVEA